MKKEIKERLEYELSVIISMGYAEYYLIVWDFIKFAKDNGIPTGVYIKEVVMDSPAMEAGLQSGDVITAVNGEAVSTVSAYNKRILALEPGEKYTVTVKRQGSNGYSKITCKVKIGILE